MKKRLGLKKEAEMMRRLYYLLASGQGIIESLLLLQKTYPALSSMTDSIRQGKSLTTSMKDKKGYFNLLTLKMIEVGELTGTLSESLLNLSEHLRQAYEIKSRMVNVIIYPIIVIFLSMAMVVFLFSYILPKILPVFLDLKIKLPWTTKILINFSHFLSSHSFVFPFFGLSLAILLCCLKLSKKFKKNFKYLVHNLPLIKKLIRMAFLISFFRSLGMMLKSRIGILEALFLISDVESNSSYKLAILGLRNHVEKGRQISSYLSSNEQVFMSISHQFISIGERSGNLSKSCLQFSEYLEHDFSNILDRAARLAEPLIMVVVGFLVGFIALSLISPLYELSRITTF